MSATSHPRWHEVEHYRNHGHVVLNSTSTSSCNVTIQIWYPDFPRFHERYDMWLDNVCTGAACDPESHPSHSPIANSKIDSTHQKFWDPFLHIRMRLLIEICFHWDPFSGIMRLGWLLDKPMRSWWSMRFGSLNKQMKSGPKIVISVNFRKDVFGLAVHGSLRLRTRSPSAHIRFRRFGELIL